MYHFTFIDEASTETEKTDIKKQENELDKPTNKRNRSNMLINRTVNFLYQYIEQSNAIRIFTRKD